MDINELEKLSIDDIDLILLTQQDLYEPWELKELEAYRDKLLEEKHKKIELEQRKSRIEEVVCPKCGGVNEVENEKCKYCGHIFRESDYYRKEEEPKKGGTFWIIGGTAMLLLGIFMNSSREIQYHFSSEYDLINPGTPLIAIGVVVTLVGLIKMLKNSGSRN